MGKLKIECVSKKINLKKLAKAVCKVLGQTANMKAELVYVGAEEMKNLNNSARGVDKITDVLSFPSLSDIRNKILKYEDCQTEMDGKYIFIGSIVLCQEKIKEQAMEYGHSEQRETLYLICHGLMHLFGYDHMTDEDKSEMREKEKRALALLGITD